MLKAFVIKVSSPSICLWHRAELGVPGGPCATGEALLLQPLLLVAGPAHTCEMSLIPSFPQDVTSPCILTTQFPQSYSVHFQQAPCLHARVNVPKQGHLFRVNIPKQGSLLRWLTQVSYKARL